MSLSVSQTKTALAPNLVAYFLAAGGVEPYAYSVLPNGAGGSIDPVTGLYTAPAAASSDPKRAYDTIQVADDDGDTVTAKILVGNALLLVCEILQKELGLADGRVFLWDQKVFQPTDAGLYLAVGVMTCKPFANTIRKGPNGWDTAVQVVNMLATLDIDIMSRGPDARDRKEEIILALGSLYAQSQQEANSFYLGKLPPGARFLNLSSIDGAAIPYRFRISVNMQYAVSKSKAVPYFDTFENVQVTTNP
jgi:hypothetical protein